MKEDSEMLWRERVAEVVRESELREAQVVSLRRAVEKRSN
jgi:hypothetical protein